MTAALLKTMAMNGMTTVIVRVLTVSLWVPLVPFMRRLVMVEIRYDMGRMNIVVSDSDEACARRPTKRAVFSMSAHRRGNAEFVGAHSLAWCDTLDNAQTLARMLIGVELTPTGAAVWPDGRTGSGSAPTPNAAHEHSAAQSRELYKARALLKRLADWEALSAAEFIRLGGWHALLWAETRAFLKHDADKGD